MAPSHAVASSKKLKPSSTLLPLLFLLLCVNFAQGLYTLPLNRIIERRLCREYYSEHDGSRLGKYGYVDEALCKISPIQGKLAALQGIMETTWIIGDFIVTIPLGFVAERYGLRLVLGMNILSRFGLLAWPLVVGYFDTMLPTKAIIASPFLSLLGGTCVFESLTYALTANLSNDNTKRAAHIAYVSSITYIVNLLGPAASAATMSIFLYMPLLMSLMLLILAFAIIRLLPNSIQAPSPRSSESNRLLASSPSPSPPQSPVIRPQDSQQNTSVLSFALAHFTSLLRLISHPSHTNLRLLLTAFLFTATAGSNTYLLTQYISIRFSWPFARAGYLLSLKSLANLSLLTVIIPYLLRIAPQYPRIFGNGGVERNWRFAMASLAISVLGVACVGATGSFIPLLSSMVLYAMGSGLPVFKFALLRAQCVSGGMDPNVGARAEEQTQSQTPLFAIALLAKTVGSLFGAPMMAAVWVRGIDRAGWALGLPYFMSAVFYGLAVWSMGRMRVSEDDREGED